MSPSKTRRIMRRTLRACIERKGYTLRLLMMAIIMLPPGGEGYRHALNLAEKANNTLIRLQSRLERT